MGGRGSSSGSSAATSGKGLSVSQDANQTTIPSGERKETYSWKTEKGSTVEVEVSWEQERMTGDWGDETKTGRIERRVTSFKVDGKEVSRPNLDERTKDPMVTGYVGTQKIGTPVPPEVKEKMNRGIRESARQDALRAEAAGRRALERKRQEDIHAGGERNS